MVLVWLLAAAMTLKLLVSMSMPFLDVPTTTTASDSEIPSQQCGGAGVEEPDVEIVDDSASEQKGTPAKKQRCENKRENYVGI